MIEATPTIDIRPFSTDSKCKFFLPLSAKVWFCRSHFGIGEHRGIKFSGRWNKPIVSTTSYAGMEHYHSASPAQVAISVISGLVVGRSILTRF